MTKPLRIRKPFIAGLPEKACVFEPRQSHNLLMVHRGVRGFTDTGIRGNRSMAGNVNTILGVTANQAEALVVGSIFGFGVPGVRKALAGELYKKRMAAAKPDYPSRLVARVKASRK